MTTNEGLKLLPNIYAPRDRFPLSLDGLRGVSRHIVVGQDEDRETAVNRLSRFYLDGFDRYAKRMNIFSDLPHEDLWPDKYEDAYQWMLSAYNELEGSPRLIFDEVIKNADMHGRGFRGATAAWVNPSSFVFRIADKGLGFGSSQEHGDGVGTIFISNFATEPIRAKKQKNGFILGFGRDLNRVELPEKEGMFGEDISQEVAFIQQRRAQGKKLPQYHPDSRVSYGFNPNEGPFGATVTYNRLGKVINVQRFDKEPEPWD